METRCRDERRLRRQKRTAVVRSSPVTPCLLCTTAASTEDLNRHRFDRWTPCRAEVRECYVYRTLTFPIYFHGLYFTAFDHFQTLMCSPRLTFPTEISNVDQPRCKRLRRSSRRWLRRRRLERIIWRMWTLECRQMTLGLLLNFISVRVLFTFFNRKMPSKTPFNNLKNGSGFDSRLVIEFCTHLYNKLNTLLSKRDAFVIKHLPNLNELFYITLETI